MSFVEMPVVGLAEWVTTKEWLARLDPNSCYTLGEELTSGAIATHWKTDGCAVFSYEELCGYIHNIWLDSHPPELVICPCPAP